MNKFSMTAAVLSGRKEGKIRHGSEICVEDIVFGSKVSRVVPFNDVVRIYFENGSIKEFHNDNYIIGNAVN